MRLPDISARFLALVFLLFCLPLTGQAAQSETLTSEYSASELFSDVDAIVPGKPFWVALHLKLEPGWHTYWKNPGDSGIPLSVKWSLPAGFAAGEIQYPPPEREAYAGLMNFGYQNDVYYLIKITPPEHPSSDSVSLQAKTGWLVCKDICIPEEHDYALTLAVGSEAAPGEKASLLQDVIAKLPSSTAALSAYESDNKLHILLGEHDDSKAAKSEVFFFPEQSGLIKNAEPQTKKDGVLSIARTQVKLPTTLKGVLSVSKESVRHDYDVSLKLGAPLMSTPQPAIDAFSLVAALFSAFLGGLILNLMPCVFPVLSLKALDIAKKTGHDNAKVRAKGLAYTLGILLSFLLMALVLAALRSSGVSIGWGMQMQSPFYVGIFAYVLLLAALNLSGLFELPVLFGDVGGHIAGKDTTFGNFATGVLAVAVATPCTAPFMATAIGYAFTQPLPQIVAVFLTLGLGLACPFLLISFIPALRRFLPKPGPWLGHFREFLAFPMYLSVVWLLWVLAQQAGIDILLRVMVGFVLLALGLWLYRALSAKWLAAIFILVSLYPIYLLPLSMHASEQKVSFGEPFTPALLEQYRAAKRPVFVDVTAAWCLSCQVNEKLALSSEHLQNTFKEKDVAYLVADWTRRDDSITRYLASFGRSGVPLYVYYPPEGEPRLLPQLLTERIVLGSLSQ